MKSFKNYILETVSKKYQPKTKDELKELCDDLSIHLGDIDTSLITNMNNLFRDSKRTNKQFEGIEDWDVSKVENMVCMFYNCKDFNRNLNKWNVSKVTDMNNMFWCCMKFNQPLNNWDVSKVVKTYQMFISCRSFNQPLNKWKLNNLKEADGMFYRCESFEKDISNWDFKNVEIKTNLFTFCNLPLNYRPKNWETF